MGILPETENIANSTIDWSGIHWTQIVWTEPESAKLMAHELFHRIQDRLGLPMSKLSVGANKHLDTREGRYYMQLEWRGLARALEAANEADSRSGIADALLFRLARYRLFPDAQAQEQALELNEGLAEYTGVKIGYGSGSGAAQTRAAISDLNSHKSDPSFSRSFAYATGPAYGLLLDSYAPAWRNEIVKGKTSLAPLLGDALKISPPADIEASAKTRATIYNGVALWQDETARDDKRKDFVHQCESRFVNGHVLMLPHHHMKTQFDPRNVQTLDNYGVVYQDLRVADDWGVLEVKNGALLKPDQTVVVELPTDSPSPLSARRLTGNGWTLDLSALWDIVPGERAGDYTLRQRDL